MNGLGAFLIAESELLFSFIFIVYLVNLINVVE